MAEKLGISQPVVSDYERGAVRLHGELILKVAEILNVTADELLGRETKKPKARPSGKVQQIFEEVSDLPRASWTMSSGSSPPSSDSNGKPKRGKSLYGFGWRSTLTTILEPRPPKLKSAK